MSKSAEINSIRDLRRQKPVRETGILINALKKQAKDISVRKNREVVINENGIPCCILLLEGRVAVQRISDGRVLGIVQSPVLMGLSGLMYDNSDLKFYACSDIRIVRIPLDTVFETIKNEQLWEPLANYLLFMTGAFHHRSRQHSPPDAVMAIRRFLTDLIQEPENVRRDMTACRYIQEHTGLSRSWIMKNLSLMQREGEIEIRYGRLVSVREPLL